MYLGKRADREASTPGSEIEYDDEIRSRIATGVTKSDGGQHGLAFSVDDGEDKYDAPCFCHSSTVTYYNMVFFGWPMGIKNYVE